MAALRSCRMLSTPLCPALDGAGGSTQFEIGGVLLLGMPQCCTECVDAMQPSGSHDELRVLLQLHEGVRVGVELEKHLDDSGHFDVMRCSPVEIGQGLLELRHCDVDGRVARPDQARKQQYHDLLCASVVDWLRLHKGSRNYTTIGRNSQLML